MGATQLPPPYLSPATSTSSHLLLHPLLSVFLLLHLPEGWPSAPITPEIPARQHIFRDADQEALDPELVILHVVVPDAADLARSEQR